MVIFTLTFVI